MHLASQLRYHVNWRKFHVRLTQGAKQLSFGTLAADPTTAVLTCVESVAWRAKFGDAELALEYEVHEADGAYKARGVTLSDEVDARAVQQYNRAIAGRSEESDIAFTVFGTYPGCDDRYAGGVRASDATDAALRAIEEWRRRNFSEEVNVKFCGLATGDVLPVDADYASSEWSRDCLLVGQEQPGEVLQTFTVITLRETAQVKATRALHAESGFGSDEVAAVLIGHVENLWDAVDCSLVEWSLERPARQSLAMLMSPFS